MFGKGHELQVLKKISQPDQFAAKESVRVEGPKHSFDSVRIVGPARAQTQLEICTTDAYYLGISAKIAVSGQLENSSGGVTLVGPKGTVVLEEGVIIPQRHLHIEAEKAKAWHVKHLDTVSVKVGGSRSVVFNNIVVRARPEKDALALHLDTDEANAAGVVPGQKGELVVGG